VYLEPRERPVAENVVLPVGGVTALPHPFSSISGAISRWMKAGEGKGLKGWEKIPFPEINFWLQHCMSVVCC